MKCLWENNKKKKWYVNDKCPDWLLSQEGDFTYKIDDIDFDKKLFDGVRKGHLAAQEVFAIENAEQRRVAYTRMDKTKMAQLKDFKVISTAKDGKDINGKTLKAEVVSFKMPGYDDPFRYLHCFCHSTGREYYIETQEDDVKKAKARSFGLDALKFGKEW
jgi:hypothetical protein